MFVPDSSRAVELARKSEYPKPEALNPASETPDKQRTACCPQTSSFCCCGQICEPLNQNPHVAAPCGADEALAAAHFCAVALPPLQGRESPRFGCRGHDKPQKILIPGSGFEAVAFVLMIWLQLGARFVCCYLCVTACIDLLHVGLCSCILFAMQYSRKAIKRRRT